MTLLCPHCNKPIDPALVRKAINKELAGRDRPGAMGKPKNPWGPAGKPKDPEILSPYEEEIREQQRQSDARRRRQGYED